MKAAILCEHNQPLVVTEVTMEDLAPGQVLCNMLVSGICGKQLGEIRGEYDEKAPLPRILGHEGCAIVEATGPGVIKVKKGDKVVCHWRKSSGMDAAFPRYCSNFWFYTGRIATFAEQTIISENRLTKVPHETPNELCALLGCGLSTALGVMENEAKLKMGENVLIVGCGGVGLNLIRVAKMLGAARVVGRDQDPPQFRSAKACGADGTECRFTTPPYTEMFDVIVDTTGSPEAIADTIPRLNPSGRFIMVGQPKTGAQVILYAAKHMFDGDGKVIRATQGGQFNPDKDIPRIVAMWRSGALKLDGIVTHRFSLDRINEALDLARSGQAGRVMIEMV